MFDEEGLIEEAKKHCEEFIRKEQRSLATFTRDSSLIYMPEEKLKRFVFNPSNGTLYLPLASFLNKNLDENQIMWHIYYELALYSDWKKEPGRYSNRRKDWQKEIDHMSNYILSRIRKDGLGEDPAYRPSIISNYVKKEVVDFLYSFDKYLSFLRVLQICPIYRDDQNFKKIILYMKQTGRSNESIAKMPRHRAFINNFITIELYKQEPEIEGVTENPFHEKIFNMSFYEFIRHELIRQINKEEGIIERDPFIRSFVFPTFEKLWKQEIDEMELHRSTGQKEDNLQESNGIFEQFKTDEIQDSLESTQEEVEKIVEELADQEKNIIADMESIMEGKINLESYGISQDDQELFRFYSNKMKKERDEMKRFWKKLIGDQSKEINVKKHNQVKGKLDIDNLIHSYPDFVEAEKKMNYKKLSIFNRYLLESQTNILPEKIEISFVIDNSGSMNEGKIDAARKALAVTLLSIDDFNRYLENNIEKLKQKIEVRTETWFFGSRYYNIKEFNYRGAKEKEKSDIIRSIVHLDGKDGATDDGSCLKEISNTITSQDQTRIRKGNQIKIVFQITDGASSFPGMAKKAVEELLSKNVIVYGFQIGKNNQANEKVFNFVWNEGYKESHGIIVGEEVEKLPKELLKAIGQNIKSVFNK